MKSTQALIRCPTCGTSLLWSKPRRWGLGDAILAVFIFAPWYAGFLYSMSNRYTARFAMTAALAIWVANVLYFPVKLLFLAWRKEKAQCPCCATSFTPAETPRKTPASPEAPPPAYRVRT